MKIEINDNIAGLAKATEELDMKANGEIGKEDPINATEIIEDNTLEEDKPKDIRYN